MSRSCSFPAVAAACVLLVLLATSPAVAQIGAIGNTTSTPVPGAPHDYIVGLNEVVNPANGSVSLRLPAYIPHERGLNVPAYAYMYDSNGWYSLSPTWITDYSGARSQQPFQGLEYLTYAIPQNGIPIPGNFDWQQATVSVQIPTGQSTFQTYTCTVYSGYVYTDRDGGRHALGIAFGQDVTPVPGGCAQIGFTNYYYQGGDIHYKYIYGGSVVDVRGDNVGTDVNGNGINSTTGRIWVGAPGYTGRTIFSPSQTTFTPSLGDGTYTYTRQQVSAGFTLNMHQVSQNQPWGGCILSSIQPLGSSGVPPVNVVYYPVTVLTLPNGQQYTFSYDPTFGLLNKITYPTGATVEYTWSINPSAEGASYYSDGPAGHATCSFQYDWFAITKRVVKPDGVNPSQEQDFSYQTTWPSTPSYQWTSKTTTVTTKDLIRSTSFNTVYTYAPYPSPPSSPSVTNDVGFVPQESSIAYYNTDGSLLKTVYKVWGVMDLLGAECEQLPNGLTSGKFYQYQPYAPFSNANVLDYSATLTDALTDVAEYDYGTVTTPCVQPSTVPMRETKTTYASFGDTPLFNGHNPIQDRPATVKVYGVVNGSQTLVQETDYAYDETAPVAVTPAPYGHDETHYGSGSTVPRGNPTTVTEKCFVGSQNCTNSVTKYSYDTTGQVLSVQDGNGNTTSYSYTDKYTTDNGSPPGNTNAYVTTITKPVTNGVSHITKFQYGFQDGKLRNITDENSQITKFCYWTGGCSGTTFDPFIRLTETDYPDGGKTNIIYNDSPYNPSTPSPSITTTRAMTSSTNLTSMVAYDGLGHPVRSAIMSDPDCAAGDRTDTTYDGLGRTYTASNPYCSTTDPTYGLTTYAYDALGRTTQLTHPDNSTVLTTYVGRAIQVQDEGNGNGAQRVTRISQVDGLGRLSSVCEVASAPFVGSGGASSSSLIGSNGTPLACGQDIAGTGFLTTYQYDTLGNLLQVNQTGISARTFNYDSLSRLLCASNPENSSALCPATPTSGYTAGTTGYTYDANGNLLTKTAPAPNQTGTATVTTCFGTWSGTSCGGTGYDALNRLTQKSYSDGVTPAVSYAYDNPCNSAYQYLTGRLAYSSVTGWSFCSGYDPMGRLVKKTLIMSSPSGDNYLNYTYDLLGDITTQTAGYGTASNIYNTAARLTSVTSSYSDANNPKTLVSGMHYNAFGALTSDTLSMPVNNETESWTYNKRGWPQSYTAVFNTTPTTPVYSYNITSYAPNGDILAVNDSANSNWNYSYDQFNRLVCANLASNGTCATPPTGTPTYTYVYDRFGNRWQQNGSHSFVASFTGNNTTNNNRMDGYSYDAAGNLRNDGTHNYFYDAENRIVQVDGTLGTCTTPTSACYAYDPDGNRVEKITTVGGDGEFAGTWQFLYDQSGRMVQRFNGTLWQGNIYAGSRHLAEDGGATNISHSDWLGTERVRVFYTNNAVCETIASLPFGDGQTTTGACYHDSQLHFTGKPRDGESNLDYFGARYDSSGMGRFMSPDAAFVDQHPENPQSWNLYAYVRNNPLRNVDPDGECTRDAQGNFHGDDCRQGTGTGNEPDRVEVKSTPLSPTWRQLLGLDRTYSRANAQQCMITKCYLPVLRLEIPFGPGGGGAAFEAQEANYLAKLSAILRAAAANKGMGPAVGEAVEVTAAEAEELGKAWVGSGARVASDGKSLVSDNGLRVYRPPTFKPDLGKVQANLEQKVVSGGQPVSNFHLDIK